MKLTTRQDIEAPIAFVHARLSDFDHFERMAMRRGAEVERTDRLKSAGVGMAWRVRFPYKGRPRKVAVRFVEVEPGSLLGWAYDSAPLEGAVRVELLALAPRRTRMTMIAEGRPKTLAARLVMQSLRLARGRIQRRFDGTAGQLAVMVEGQYRALADDQDHGAGPTLNPARRTDRAR